MARLADDGKTVLYFIRENTLLGMIAVADRIKSTSRQAVAGLRRRLEELEDDGRERNQAG